MNCQDLNSVLDTHGPGELSPAQKRDIDLHLVSCRTCREAWAAYNELVAEPIPETPRDLHRRIETALEDPGTSDVSRARRSIIIGGACVVGAALATTITVGLPQRERVCA